MCAVAHFTAASTVRLFLFQTEKQLPQTLETSEGPMPGDQIPKYLRLKNWDNFQVKPYAEFYSKTLKTNCFTKHPSLHDQITYDQEREPSQTGGNASEKLFKKKKKNVVEKKSRVFLSEIPHRKKDNCKREKMEEGKDKRHTQEQMTKLIEISPMTICTIKHGGGGGCLFSVEESRDK